MGVDVAPGALLTMNFAAQIDSDPLDIGVTGVPLLGYPHEGKELPPPVEVAGFGIEVALKSEVDKASKSKVNAVIAGFALDDGIMTDRVLFADTTNMRIESAAKVNFTSQSVDVAAAPKAKRPELFSFATPVRLRGIGEDFGIRVDPLALTKSTCPSSPAPCTCRCGASSSTANQRPRR